MDNSKNRKSAEELIGQSDPGLLLELNKTKTGSNLRPQVSESVKLLLFVIAIDVLVAAIATLITGQSHFQIIAGDIAVIIPWPLAFLDGIIFIGYGIRVNKRKYGEVDISSNSQSSDNKVYVIEGEAASVLAWVYITLGVFLLALPLLYVGFADSVL